MKRHLGLFILILIIMTIGSPNLSAQDGTTYMRIAKITVDGTKLDEYKAALKEQMQSALRHEQGVLAYRTKQILQRLQSWKPTQVQTHIRRIFQTEHFKKYKVTVVDMVTQLELIDVVPIAIHSKLK